MGFTKLFRGLNAFILAMVLSALVIFSIVVFSGCNKEEVLVSEKVQGGSSTGAVESPTKAAEEKQVSYSLTSEEEKKLFEILNPGKKTALSTSYKTMSIGDVYVFAIGITNIFPDEKSYKIEVEFKEGKENVGGIANLITDIDDTIYTWFAKNKFEVKKLKSEEQAVIPLIVEIKPKIGANKNTVVGTYNFDIKVMYESSPQFWDLYESNLLSIRVK
ncbi:MAG: hypothetical protein N3D84_01530 [Candidatus Woesearchaeota archaeon]|nr:hypothetical protein [Candidatus Woesearchaeota archaeon]